MKLLDEPILVDTYPIYDYPVPQGYWYIIDGLLVQSPIIGTVADLKRLFQATEIRRCDIIGRGLKWCA